MMTLLEFFFERRPPRFPKSKRLVNNLLLVIASSFVLRVFFPVLAVGIAEISNKSGFGLFARLSMPVWLEGLITLLLLDCVIYWQHRVFHNVDILWKLHRVHHTDLDFDSTTGVRFHPIEIAISMLVKMVAVFLLAPSMEAVIIFEILLNSCALFNHSNVKLPLTLDGVLRRFLITPDFHRIHHSIVDKEMNSNFGFSIPLWDILFRTRIKQPKAGHDEMEIGVKGFDEKRSISLPILLMQPFLND